MTRRNFSLTLNKGGVRVLDLTYKENVSDTRESPVREMVKEPKEFGVDVYDYDLLLGKEEIEAFGVKSSANLDVKMDCVIVAVAHEEFKKIKLDEIKKCMNDKPVIVDVRGMFNEEEAKREGFYYKTL